MLNGDVRIFKVTRRNEEDIIQHPKRLSVDNPTTTSANISKATASSTATLVEETININLKLLTTENHNRKTRNLFSNQVKSF